MTEQFKEALDAWIRAWVTEHWPAPWWCPICGGHSEDWVSNREDTFMVSPPGHECPPPDPNHEIVGLRAIIEDTDGVLWRVD
jgi:hypothetical protein